MPSFSQTIIMGHLGKDPEIRFLNNGSAVTNFTVATSEKWKDKQSGEQKEKTEWHNCFLFGNQAERAAEWLHKGSLVHVVGQNETQKWQDKEGNDRYTTKVKVWKFTPMDKAPAKPQAQESFDDDAPF